MKVSALLFVTVTLVVMQVTLGKRDKPEREERGSCRYDRAQWGECSATGQKTRTLALKKGPDTCENPKIETKACRSSDDCKYEKAEWSECDTATDTKTRVVALSQGDPATCEATRTDTKSCKDEGRAGARKQARQDRRGGRRDQRRGGDDCQFDRAEWSACDEDTDMMTMMMTLQADQPDTCNATKTVTKRCRGQGGKSRGCKYEVTRTTDCVDGKAVVTRTLVPGSPTTCEATKTAEKRCATAARAAKRQEKKDARQARKEARKAGGS